MGSSDEYSSCVSGLFISSPAASRGSICIHQQRSVLKRDVRQSFFYLADTGTYGNKLKVPNFPMSEAEFLIWSLDQREDWAVIVCLVGGGQEINTGEAGITEWIKALNSMFKHWDVYISDKLTDVEYAEGRVNDLLKDNPKVTFAEDLHLAVSLRSFRAETLSAFVQSMLAFRSDAADLYKDVEGRGYPIVLTRDMDTARA